MAFASGIRTLSQYAPWSEGTAWIGCALTVGGYGVTCASFSQVPADYWMPGDQLVLAGTTTYLGERLGATCFYLQSDPGITYWFQASFTLRPAYTTWNSFISDVNTPAAGNRYLLIAAGTYPVTVTPDTLTAGMTGGYLLSIRPRTEYYPTSTKADSGVIISGVGSAGALFTHNIVGGATSRILIEGLNFTGASGYSNAYLAINGGGPILEVSRCVFSGTTNRTYTGHDGIVSWASGSVSLRIHECVFYNLYYGVYNGLNSLGAIYNNTAYACQYGYGVAYSGAALTNNIAIGCVNTGFNFTSAAPYGWRNLSSDSSALDTNWTTSSYLAAHTITGQSLAQLIASTTLLQNWQIISDNDSSTSVSVWSMAGNTILSDIYAVSNCLYSAMQNLPISKVRVNFSAKGTSAAGSDKAAVGVVLSGSTVWSTAVSLTTTSYSDYYYDFANTPAGASFTWANVDDMLVQLKLTQGPSIGYAAYCCAVGVTVYYTPGNITGVTPSFVNLSTFDLRLNSGDTVAQNLGCDLTTISQQDFFGHFRRARMDGTGFYDIGAYEIPAGLTFYFSYTGGTDSYTYIQAGSPDTPWQTLSRLCTYVVAYKIIGGDAILFNRGDTWDQTLAANPAIFFQDIFGSPDAYFKFSNYGVGNLPCFTSYKSFRQGAAGISWWQATGLTTGKIYYLAKTDKSAPTGMDAQGIYNVAWEPEFGSVLHNQQHWRIWSGNDLASHAGPTQLVQYEWTYGKWGADPGITVLYFHDPFGPPGYTINVIQNNYSGMGLASIYLWNCKFMEFDGLQFYGTWGSITAGGSAEGLILKNLVGEYFGGNGIDLLGTLFGSPTLLYRSRSFYISAESSAWTPCTISNCVVRYAGSQGVHVSGNVGSVSGCTVEHSMIFALGHDGNLFGTIFERNYVYHCCDEWGSNQFGWQSLECASNNGLGRRFPGRPSRPTIYRYNWVKETQKNPNSPYDGGGINLRENYAEAYYNIVMNCWGPGIRVGVMSEQLSGVQNCKIYNNVSYMNKQYQSIEADLNVGGITIAAAAYGGSSALTLYASATFRNNICVLQPGNTISRLASIGNYVLDVPVTFDNNLYYQTLAGFTSTYNKFSTPSGGGLTWGGWHTSGFDISGVALDPKLAGGNTCIAEVDFKLSAGSPAYNAGATTSTAVTGFPGMDYFGNAAPR